MFQNENKNDSMLNQEKNNINEEDINLIEFLITEKEDDTDFGRFLARVSKKLFQVVEFLNIIVMFIMSIFHWITKHLFLICFIFVAITISITYFSQRITLF